MAKRKHYNWCAFFEHIIKPNGDDKRLSRHIYPIPVCHRFPEGGQPGEGATCCLKHYSRIFKLQVDQGLVIPVQ